MLIRDLASTVFASALHCLKSVKMGHRITDSRFAAWVCGEGAVIANLRYGARAVVFINQYGGRAMYLWGEHDPRITAVADAVLRSGDTAIDLGANFGVVGLFVAKRVGASGRVHLFEPQPIVASCLRTSTFINGYTQTVVHECALSDRKGQAQMTIVDPSNWGMTTLTPLADDSGTGLRTISVPTEHAGEFVTENCGDKVDFIKIDVEGHEATIFRAMSGWLSRVKVPVILFECHLKGTAFQDHETVKLLSALGYEFLSFDMKPFWNTRLIQVQQNPNPAGRDFVAVLWNQLSPDRRIALQSMVTSEA